MAEAAPPSRLRCTSRTSHPMNRPDLNLLTALDALLSEASVAGAARRLGLSPSAMSRTLTRLRETTGDPLLARVGRGLALTPHAASLREGVRAATLAAQAALAPAPSLDVSTIDRLFTIRANDGFVEIFAARLVAEAARAAPRARLRFAPKPDKAVAPLREGAVDLDIGVLGEQGAELRMQGLFNDTFVGVMRRGHPLLAGEVTAEVFASARHVVATRRGRLTGPVDEALAKLGLAREIAVLAPSFTAVMAITAASDLVGSVTRSYAESRLSHDPAIVSFALPVTTPEIAVSQIWHPRFDADPAHRWLRGLVFSVCRAR
jgi:DNA-binding transcriptional LysR family regulator